MKKNSLNIFLARTKIKRSKSSLTKVINANKLKQNRQIYQRIQIVDSDPVLNQQKQQERRFLIQYQVDDKAETKRNLIVVKFLQRFSQTKGTLIKVRDLEQPASGNLKELSQSRKTRLMSFDQVIQSDQSGSEDFLSSKSLNILQDIKQLSQQVLIVKNKKNYNCRPVLCKEIKFDKSTSLILKNRKRNKTSIECCKARRQNSVQFLSEQMIIEQGLIHEQLIKMDRVKQKEDKCEKIILFN